MEPLEHAKYAPGMRAIIRDEEWTITKVEKNELKNDVLHCVGTSPLVRNREAIFLADLETVEIVDPKAVRLVPDASRLYMRSKLYLESLWRAKTPTGPQIYVGHRAARDPIPYQLDPAAIALRRPRQRILIADTVGLGKTLEAGILLSELIARGKGRRILVVTVKSMTAQFQKEMWNRFTIPLVRLDSKKFKQIRRALPSNYNPFTYYDKTIISIDTLKRDLEYRSHLEKAYWDVIVIDEAQNVAERGTGTAQRAKLAKALANRSDTMIMLSATPHDGSAKSFASLMNILDPTAIPNPNEYTKEDVGGLCVRRFKKDVKGQTSGAFLDRRVELVRAKANALEERAFDVLTSLKLKMDEKRVGASSAGQGMLFKTTLAKALFSSPAACAETIRNRIKRLDAKHGDERFADVPALQELLDAVLAIGESGEHFTRYQALLALLRDPAYGWTRASDDRIVIFTERRATKNFLVEALRRDLAEYFKNPKSAIEEVDGETSDVDLQRKVEDFGRDDSPVRILVASDVASEGLNLHYRCHRLIHFDIPWSLMVFQQRNGRVDRYGQPKEPDIRYMLVESDNKTIRGDMRVFEILVRKETEAAKNIGDPAQLMGKFVVEEEEFRVAEAFETEEAPEDFEKSLDATEEGFDIFNELFELPEEDKSASVETVDVRTLYRDRDYLKAAFDYLASNNDFELEEKPSVKTEPVQEISNYGLSIWITPGLRKRLDALLPDEAKPAGNRLLLTDSPAEMMEAMKRSMLNNADETAWPETSYLWPLHPVFSYVGEKCSVLFGRGEAPVIELGTLGADEIVFIISGSIPNERSAPVVDEWFALRYEGGLFQGEEELDGLFQRTKFYDQTPNVGGSSGDQATKFAAAAALVSDAVDKARERFNRRYNEYNARMTPALNAEEQKLDDLCARRRAAQLELFTNARFGGERKKKETLDSVDKLFNDFKTWVSESMTIQDNPYVRIVAVLQGRQR